MSDPLLTAERDSLASMLLDVQRECVEVRAALTAAEARVTALEAEKAGLAKALAEVKAAILDETNGLAIQCTIFMPAKPHPHETVVDFIDQALSRNTEKNDGA